MIARVSILVVVDLGQRLDPGRDSMEWPLLEVSILVVVDLGQRRFSPRITSMIVFVFQSLLSWISVNGLETTPACAGVPW